MKYALITMVLLFLGVSSSVCQVSTVFTQEESTEIYRALISALNRNAVNYAPKTHTFCWGPPENVPTPEQIRDLNPNPVGYGSGIDDCALFTGTVIIGALELHEMTGDPRMAALARDNYLGLKFLGAAHGISGYVTRGVSPVDGRSTYITSSRDQYTHYVEALWRYYRSPLATEKDRTEIRLLFARLADSLAEDVCAENDWSILRADGTKDPRGLHKMWHVYAHEAARLPMIYLAAWDVTGDERYRTLYHQYAREAVAQSLTLKTLPPRDVAAWVPTYSFYQMQCSLQLLYRLEPDAEFKAEILRAIRETKTFTAIRFPWLEKHGGARERAEILTSQLILPELELTAEERAVLEKTFRNPNLANVGVGDVTHLLRLYAAACRAGVMPLPEIEAEPGLALPMGDLSCVPDVESVAWQARPARLDVDPHQVVFLGDAHLSADAPGHFALFEKTCELVLALRPRPAVVIFTGDLAANGLESEYQMARPIFEKFEAAGIPVKCVLGERDRREAFRAVFPSLKSGSEVQNVPLERADFLLLDTPDGTLSDAEKSWLASEIQRHRESGKAFYIVTHQPPAELGLPELVQESEQCLALLHCHTHAYSLMRKEDRPKVKGLQSCVFSPGTSEHQGFTYLQLERWEHVFRPVIFDEDAVWARRSDVLRLR